MLTVFVLISCAFCAAPYILSYETTDCQAGTLSRVRDDTYLTSESCYESVVGTTGYESARTKCTGGVLDYYVTYGLPNCVGPNTTHPAPFDTCVFGTKLSCTSPENWMVYSSYEGGVNCTAVLIELEGARTIQYSATPNFGKGCIDNTTLGCDPTNTSLIFEGYLDYGCTVLDLSVTLVEGCNTAVDVLNFFGHPIFVEDMDVLCSACGTCPYGCSPDLVCYGPCDEKAMCEVADADFCCDSDTAAACDSNNHVTSTTTACTVGCHSFMNDCYDPCDQGADCSVPDADFCCALDRTAHCDATSHVLAEPSCGFGACNFTTGLCLEECDIGASCTEIDDDFCCGAGDQAHCDASGLVDAHVSCPLGCNSAGVCVDPCDVAAPCAVPDAPFCCATDHAANCDGTGFVDVEAACGAPGCEDATGTCYDVCEVGSYCSPVDADYCCDGDSKAHCDATGHVDPSTVTCATGCDSGVGDCYHVCDDGATCTDLDDDFCCGSGTTAHCTAAGAVDTSAACTYGCNSPTGVCFSACEDGATCSPVSSDFCCAVDEFAHCDVTGYVDDQSPCTGGCEDGECFDECDVGAVCAADFCCSAGKAAHCDATFHIDTTEICTISCISDTGMCAEPSNVGWGGGPAVYAGIFVGGGVVIVLLIVIVVVALIVGFMYFARKSAQVVDISAAPDVSVELKSEAAVREEAESSSSSSESSEEETS